MFPHINTNLSPGIFPQSGEYRNGSPKKNSRRLVSLNDYSLTKLNCACGSEFGEPCVCELRPKLSPSNSMSRIQTGPINLFSDFNPDPSLFKIINIESEAVKLALYTLGISESEYNGLSIENIKRFPNTIPESYAVNILIEHKRKYGMNISPVKRDSQLSNEIKLNNFIS